MLAAPKTASPLLTLENGLARFELVDGDGDFVFVGISEIEKKGTGSSIVFLNAKSLWEIICVRPTRDVESEHFKVVLPSAEDPAAVASSITGGSRVTLTWSDILVDGDASDTELDRLNVVVELDLMDDEAFLRMRIRAFWSVNNSAVSSDPGRYAIWRVKFPIIDFRPTSDDALTGTPDSVGDDALVLPECQGVVVDNPQSRASGDAVVGMWEPQDREVLVRNVIRPGNRWRQSYPGKASTQMMGYYGKNSGRGALLGVLDPVGHIKDLEAGADDGSIWMTVIHVPAWCYTVGNRPSGFTGSQVGDNQAEFEALGSHLPQSEQVLPPLEDNVPDAYTLAPGPATDAADDVANAGQNLLGEMRLGFPGAVNTNTLGDLGYRAPYDCVLMPTQGYGPEGWNALADAWRDIAVLPDAAFPLRETEYDPDRPQPASQSSVLLEVDASIHEGQRTMLGTDEAGLPTALEESDGIVADAESVRDLIVPSEIVAPRSASNDIEVLEAENLIESRSVLGADGALANVENVDAGESGRGYLKVYGTDGYYVAPVQIEQNYFSGNFPDDGGVRFESIDVVTEGIQVGDIVRMLRVAGSLETPLVGRTINVEASDSEPYPFNGDSELARVVKQIVDSSTIIVGRYRAGEIEPYAWSSSAANNPNKKFEVEILREELNSRATFPVLTGGVVRVNIRVVPTVINDCYPASALGWAEVVEIEGVEYEFKRLYVSGSSTFLEFDPGGQETDFFSGKTVRVRRRVSPVDFVAAGISEGDHFVLGGVTLNDPHRVIEFGDTDDATVLMRDGILGFEQPVVTEVATGEGFTLDLYSPAAGANRLLGPEVDVVGAGRRFIDVGISQSGGFPAIARAGDVLEITNAAELSNQDLFDIVEVQGDFALLVDRDFVTEEDPGGGFTYRLLRRGSVVRDLSLGRRGFLPFRAGPRALLFDGRDRVHFLAIGHVVDPTASVTGVFGVDSEAWADLGANPFIPATSANLTTYRTSSRGIRLPSQEFKVTALEGERISLARGWEIEDSTFSVTFTDEGAKTFEKNVVQYRIVRDDREIADLYDWAGSEQALASWGTALETSALLALVRGWQPHILSWDQPGYLPPRGRYLEFVAENQTRIISASDVHQIRPDDEDGLYAAANLEAAAYFNRFGFRAAQVPAGDPAEGESDELVHPGVPYARSYLLDQVLGRLVKAGVEDFLLDHLEEGSRPQYGSPHFFAPPGDPPEDPDTALGDPTTYEITAHGGSPDFAEGWSRVIGRTRRPFSVTTPMDWLLGLMEISTRDWGDLEHGFLDAEIPMPISGALENLTSGLTVVDNVVTFGAVDLSAESEEMYGETEAIDVGDVLELLPSTTRHIIKSVAASLTLETEPDLAGESTWRVLLKRNFAQESVNGPSVFHFAFGEFATVAADVTFLANEMSWQEVIEERGSGITQEAYDRMVSHAFTSAMYRTGAASIRGLLPSVRVESEGAQRVPQFLEGHQFERQGTNALPEQSSVQFPIGFESWDLIGMHLSYLNTLSLRMDEVPEWVRFGPSEQTPTVSGATSLQTYGARQHPGRKVPAVQASCFADEDGDLLFVLTHWAPKPIGPGTVENVTVSYSFPQRGISSGYWVLVEQVRNASNKVINSVVDVGPATTGSFAVKIYPTQVKLFMLYQQDVVVRLDDVGAEVDRVLVVPKGRSTAEAFAVIALDVVKGGSGNYVVVVGAGALQDGLDIPSIAGATIEMQASADEFPEIGEVV
jgi:hypothetical protein